MDSGKQGCAVILSPEVENPPSASITLSSDELACLFSMTGATSAMGVDSDSLFPKGDDKQTVYRRGHARLKEQGWMSTKEKTGKLALQLDLIRCIATMVRPSFVIAVEIREHEEENPRRLVYYFNQKRIVEQVYVGAAGYQLTQINDIPDVLLRIREATQWPDKNRLGDFETDMDASVFNKIKKAAEQRDVKRALPAMMKMGFEESMAQAALLSLSEPDYSGTVTMYKLSDQTVLDLQACAFFVGEGGGWLGLKPDNKGGDLIVRSADSSQFVEALADSFGRISQ